MIFPLFKRRVSKKVNNREQDKINKIFDQFDKAFNEADKGFKLMSKLGITKIVRVVRRRWW